MELHVPGFPEEQRIFVDFAYYRPGVGLAHKCVPRIACETGATHPAQHRIGVCAFCQGWEADVPAAAQKHRIAAHGGCVCVITFRAEGAPTIFTTGASFCRDMDEFNRGAGRRLALARALKKHLKLDRESRRNFWFAYHQAIDAARERSLAAKKEQAAP